MLHPPALHVLQTLASPKPLNETLNLLKSPQHCPATVPARIEFQRGIRLFPLETPTLPPATHTNCYLLGTGELLVVDPGAAAVKQYAKLLALISALKSEGMRPRAIVLTHHHADHVGGAQAVQERLGIPVWCHEHTRDRLGLRVDKVLKDGDLITLGGAPPMRFRVLHTPGHARGHLCLMEEASKAAIVGDMVAGVGTIVIDPPEGDMTDYVTQLARLRDLPVGVLYPAHGPPLADGPAKLSEYLHHREHRERQVLEALPGSGGTVSELVHKVYTDVPDFLHPLAERSVLAILIKLSRDGKVNRLGDRYSRA